MNAEETNFFALKRTDWVRELSPMCYCRGRYFVFHLCPRLLPVRGTIEHKKDNNIVLLSHLCMIAANEGLSHHDDAM